jgi:uncharacterized protein involved in exopolysaccharide biosynthesis
MAVSKSGFEVRKYYRAVAKRLWIVLLLTGLVVGVVFWRMGSQKASYSSSTLLMVNGPIITTPTTILGGGSDQGSSSSGGNVGMVINDIIQLINARPVAERVAKSLGLDGPNTVQRSVRASRIRDTDLVRIRATSNNRELAARLANTSAEVLVSQFREVNRRDAREMRVFVEQQLAQARARLNVSDQALEAYKVRRGILELDKEVSQASSDAAQMRTDRENAFKELRETEAKLAAASRRLLTEQRMRLVSGTIKENPVFQQLESRLTDLEIQNATLSQTFTSLHPKMKVIEGEIATVRQQMESVAKKIVDNEVSESNPVYDQLFTDIATKQIERVGLLARIDSLRFLEQRRRARNAQFPAIQTGMNQLVRENEVLAENYSNLSKKYQDALIRENEAGYLPARIQVMEPAVASTAPAGLRPPVRFGLAGLVGLLLGLMAALLLETADDRIRTSSEAERALGAPVLAEVPDVTPARVAPAAAALLLVMIMLLLGVALGGAFAKVDPKARVQTLGTVPSRLVRAVEAIPTWIVQAVP